MKKVLAFTLLLTTVKIVAECPSPLPKCPQYMGLSGKVTLAEETDCTYNNAKCAITQLANSANAADISLVLSLLYYQTKVDTWMVQSSTTTSYHENMNMLSGIAKSLAITIIFAGNHRGDRKNLFTEFFKDLFDQTRTKNIPAVQLGDATDRSMQELYDELS